LDEDADAGEMEGMDGSRRTPRQFIKANTREMWPRCTGCLGLDGTLAIRYEKLHETAKAHMQNA